MDSNCAYVKPALLHDKQHYVHSETLHKNVANR